MVIKEIDTCIKSLIILVFLSPTPVQECCGRRHVSVIEVQKVSMNISATKQNIFIKLEQNLG